MAVTKRRSKSKKNLKSKKSKKTKSHKQYKVHVGGSGSKRLTYSQQRGLNRNINSSGSGASGASNSNSGASNSNSASASVNSSSNAINSETYIEEMKIAKLKEQQMQAELEIERQQQIIADKKFALEKAREKQKLNQEEILMRPFEKWNPKKFKYQLYNPRTKTFI